MPIYRIEKNPKLGRRQGAYSVISATGHIVRRGHELDRVLGALDRSLRVVDGLRRPRVRSHRPCQAGRCISTVSSHRPCLKPTDRKVPTRRKPAAAWIATDAVFVESPITASICRKPRNVWNSAISRGQQQPANSVCGVIPARHRSNPPRTNLSAGRIAIRSGIGVARHCSGTLRHEIRIALVRSVSACRRAISAPSGGSISNVAVPCSYGLGVDAGNGRDVGRVRRGE